MSALGGAQLGQSAMGWWNRQNQQSQPTSGYSGQFQAAPMGETYGN
jgi:hypothetical protein